MSLKYIRDTYGIDAAKKGVRVCFIERGERYQSEGVIVGSSGPHLKVLFDGDKHPVPVHPKACIYPGNWQSVPEEAEEPKASIYGAWQTSDVVAARDKK